MPSLRPCPILFQALKPRSPLTKRLASLATRTTTTNNKSTLPITLTCPSPTCCCTPTPTNLDIDHKTSITNNIAPYTSHILISTSQADWPSRIEDSPTSTTEPWGTFIAATKSAFGRNGVHHSPTTNTLISASSLSPKSATDRTVLHFPSWREISIPTPSPPGASAPASPPSSTVADPKQQQQQDTDPDLSSLLAHLAHPPSPTQSPPPPPPPPLLPTSAKTRAITTPTILVCTHNARDTRCGVLGPLLIDEFRRHVPAATPPPATAASSSSSSEAEWRIAGVSHVGGHKWAGNVIVYLPPLWEMTSEGMMGRRRRSPLAGLGVWYGRVEPRHVEGIVKETVWGGNVVGELCRGVWDAKGGLVRI